MRTAPVWKALAVALSFAVALPAIAQQKPAAPRANWTSVEEALGRKGAIQTGDVIRFSFPRSDLTVSVAGVTLKPALAHSSRADVWEPVTQRARMPAYAS